jgi:ribosome biogenesis GTPase
MAVDRGALLVRSECGETLAQLSGKFRFAVESSTDLPCVGDWVCVEHHASGGPAIVHSILPRRTVLRRKCAGKAVDFQIIGANIDVAFIVQACHYDFNVRRLDRYLVMAREGRIEPFVILSKTDLITPEDLAGRVAQIRETDTGTKILPLSNITGTGVNAFRELLVAGKTFCLLGSSGVGKTTLINRVVGRDAFETKAVSGTGEGVHTTSRSQLVVLDNGAMLVDTPGMRELGLLGTREGMEDSFEDIHDFSLRCRFSNCTHTQEPGCAVLLAIEAGDLSEDRFQSYLKLKKETEYHDLSYAKKRKKDRNFGRFIKSVKKQGKHGK